MSKDKNLEILVDINKSGKDNDWKGKKELAMLLSESFLRLANKPENELIRDIFINKHLAVKYCSNYLTFVETTDGNKKLVDARFCRVRLCPMCTWRRTKKVFSQLSRIVQEINKDKEREYIFLTLTCKNVEGSELKQTINDLLKAFHNMFRLNKSVKKICLGYFRGLEVTRNEKDGTYHPHIHCVICVNKSYFKSKNYIPQKEWCSIWQYYLKTDYIPNVDVRKATKTYKSIAELSSYTVKPKDIILEADEETIDNNVMTLHNALHRVRLIGMGGLFKDYHKKLNLEDTNKEDLDLIHTDTEKEDDSLLTNILTTYKWNIGYKNYILEKKEIKK